MSGRIQPGDGDPPQGYANWKEWWNEQVTRKQVWREAREHLFPGYHDNHVAPIEAWLNMPVSERAWERAKAYVKSLSWPPDPPWWWKRITAWTAPKWATVRERFGFGDGEDEPLAGPEVEAP